MIEGLCNIFGTSWSEVTEKVKKTIFAWIDDIKVGFENLGKAIMQPFELAFKWIKDQYNKYIAPIVDTVKNFDIGQTAKDMWEETKIYLDLVMTRQKQQPYLHNT